MKLAVAFAPLQRITLPVLRVSVILLGFSIPISVALDNLLLAVLLLGALFYARAIWQIVTQHPVARAAWLLFAVLLLAISYGMTPLREAFGTLAKYLDLAMIPVFMLLLSRETIRHRAQYAFLAAMGLTLVLSWLVGLKLLPVQHWMSVFAEPDNPVIFYSHITQNNMMAFAIFLALLKLRDTTSMGVRIMWGIFALLGVANVLFMVQGRTGYMITLVLLGWYTWSTLARYLHRRGREWDWRHGTAVLLMLTGLVMAAYHASPQLHGRVNLVVAEYQAWQPNHGKDSSTGQRLDFYYNTLQIVRQQPVFGVGTGGFPDAFVKQTQGTDVLQTRNPHNEYLMITAQTGVVGLALLLYLFYTLWRSAPLLNNPLQQDASRGLVLAYLVNCLFNSALLDHADGLFFAFMTAVLFASLKPGLSTAEGVTRHG